MEVRPALPWPDLRKGEEGAAVCLTGLCLSWNIFLLGPTSSCFLAGSPRSIRSSWDTGAKPILTALEPSPLELTLRILAGLSSFPSSGRERLPDSAQSLRLRPGPSRDALPTVIPSPPFFFVTTSFKEVILTEKGLSARPIRPSETRTHVSGRVSMSLTSAVPSVLGACPSRPLGQEGQLNSPSPLLLLSSALALLLPGSCAWASGLLPTQERPFLTPGAAAPPS